MLTPLVGREQEIACVCAQLTRPDVRLLTLLGTGGVGKTRLSLAVATHLQAHFADGVCFVPLAPLREPELVLPALAQALHLRQRPGQPLFELLKEGLYQQHLLVVLDNVEQVAAVAPQLEEVLAACPRLKLLVTSRTLLHVPTEQVFSVPPLPLPDLTRPLASEQLTQSGAVALFVQRAQAIQPSFQLTASNAQAVAEICVRLDGLPLAIELAAARIRLLPPQALLKRLSHRLAVLTGGAQTLPERQQTLRHTLQWSYDLLDEQEQRLFQRLAVFVGGWTLEAAEAMWATTEQTTVWVLDDLASLLDKSLLLQIDQEAEDPRFRMLETVREYAHECLARTGELEPTRQAHAAYYLALAERAAPQLEDLQQQTSWMARLEQEHANLHAAMSWFVERAETESALRLGIALFRFWHLHGHLSEGQTLLKEALARSEEATAAVRAQAFYALGCLAQLQDDLDQASALCEQSLLLSRELGEKRGIVNCLLRLGVIGTARSSYREAQRLAAEALAISRELADPGGIAQALLLLAWVAFYQGEYAKAQALIEESLVLFRQVKELWQTTCALQLLTRIYLAQGEEEAARLVLMQEVTLAEQVDFKQEKAYALMLLGNLSQQQDDLGRAGALLQESIKLFREVGDRTGLSEALLLLARAQARQRDEAAAAAYYQESLTIASAIGNQWAIASAAEGLAGVVAAQGELAWAVQLWGTAQAIRETIGSPLPPMERTSYEGAVALARQGLGKQAFVAAWAQGRRMTPEQALAAQGRPVPSLSAPLPPATPSAPPAISQVPPPANLTPREVEVLRLVASGLSNIQVSERLVISARTVDTHLTSIYSKIGVSSRSAATRYALEHHLV